MAELEENSQEMCNQCKGKTRINCKHWIQVRSSKPRKLLAKMFLREMRR